MSVTSRNAVMSDDPSASGRIGPTEGPRLISELPFTALGGQPAFEPAALERFVSGARIAVMSYLRKDGRSGQAPIWYVYRDGVFHLSTGGGSPKDHALRRDPRVCVTIQDERAPYRAVIFDAVAELSEPGPQVATSGIERRYFGRIGGKAYLEMSEQSFADSGHTEIILRPTDVRGFDNTRQIGRATLAFLRARPHLPLLRRVL